MMFFEIYLNCDENGEGGERYHEDGKPFVAFTREDADRTALDLMTQDITRMVVVSPVKG